MSSQQQFPQRCIMVYYVLKWCNSRADVKTPKSSALEKDDWWLYNDSFWNSQFSQFSAFSSSQQFKQFRQFYSRQANRKIDRSANQWRLNELACHHSNVFGKSVPRKIVCCITMCSALDCNCKLIFFHFLANSLCLRFLVISAILAIFSDFCNLWNLKITAIT